MVKHNLGCTVLFSIKQINLTAESAHIKIISMAVYEAKFQIKEQNLSPRACFLATASKLELTETDRSIALPVQCLPAAM